MDRLWYPTLVNYRVTSLHLSGPLYNIHLGKIRSSLFETTGPSAHACAIRLTQQHLFNKPAYQQQHLNELSPRDVVEKDKSQKGLFITNENVLTLSE